MKLEKNFKYDSILGYGEIGNIDFSKLKHRIELLKEKLKLDKVTNLLIVGCGNGHEAIAFSEVLNCKVVGLDLNAKPLKSNNLEIIKADATSLPFDDGSFDFVYCAHVLEHVSDPPKVVEEIYRVLKNKGGIFIAVPNKYRILPMYWSSHLKIPISNFIRYNLRDMWFRITFRWSNEKGAHAGYSHKEIDNLFSKFKYNFDSFPSLKFFNILRSSESKMLVRNIPITLKITGIK
jgi:ubiquinone/menaquinone biosynthesis C-methylase UbiE